MIKRILLLTLMLGLLCAESKGQQTSGKYQVVGQVIDDEKGDPVAFASIVFSDSTGMVAGLAADRSGSFNLRFKKAGKYKVTITAVGYTAPPIEINIDPELTRQDLGRFVISKGVQLDQITVTMVKPVIREEPDKLVYSVENDPISKTGQLVDVLRKVPMLSVDNEDNVTLMGQSNYKVLVNGKTSTMYSNNFKDVVRSLPANSIKEIEVITNPSSKYDAEGIDGIINIITNRAKIEGYTASVGAGVNTRGGYNGNAYLATTVGKFTVSARVNYNKNKNPKEIYENERTNYEVEDNHFQRTYGENNNKYNFLSGSMEASYEIDSTNLISASMNIWSNKFNSNSNNEISSYNINNSLYSLMYGHNENNTGYTSLSAGLDYQRLYKKKDKSLTFSYRYGSSPNPFNTISDIEGKLNAPSYRMWQRNDAKTNEHTFQTDYYEPITTKHIIEGGVKYILRLNNTDPETYNWDYNDERWVYDPTRENKIDYNQNIYSAYAAYQLKLKKWSFRAGARAEGTHNVGYYKTGTKNDFNYNYFNMVPYANVSWTVKPRNTIKFSYAQRLSRPSVGIMNPYVDTSTPYYKQYGNPDLKVEIGHSFNLQYSLSANTYNLSVSADARVSNNSISSYSFVDSDGVLNSTYGNIGRREAYRLNFYGSYNPSSKFQINGSVAANYMVNSSKEIIIQSNNDFGYYGNMQVRVALYKELYAQAFIFYQSPMQWGLQYKQSSQWSHSVSLQQSFLKKKLFVNLNINSPFQKTLIIKGENMGSSFSSVSRHHIPIRFFGLSASYRFGNLNAAVKKARRGVSNDDGVQSSGGGQGGSGSGSGN